MVIIVIAVSMIAVVKARWSGSLSQSSYDRLRDVFYKERVHRLQAPYHLKPKKVITLNHD